MLSKILCRVWDLCGDRPDQHLRLPVQGHVPGKFPAHDIGDQRRRRHAAFKHSALGRRLHDSALTSPAGVFRPHGAQDPQGGRHTVQRLGDVLTDLVQPPSATGALGRRRLDDLNQPRKMLWQGANVAPGRSARVAPQSSRLRRLIVEPPWASHLSPDRQDRARSDRP